MNLNETNAKFEHDHYDHIEIENVAAWDMKNARLDHDDHVVNVAACESKNEKSTTANMHVEDSMDYQENVASE